MATTSNVTSHSLTTSSPHLVTPDTALLESDEFTAYDILIGSCLTLFFLVGVPGNALGIKYFLSKRKDVATSLYLVICTIDLCSSLSLVPVILVLFNGRQPGMFGERVFCVAWYTTIFYLQRIAVFSVMLLSVSRTIVIVSPFYKVTKKAVLLSFIVYSILLLLHITIPNAVTETEFEYFKPEGMCTNDIISDGVLGAIDEGLNTMTVAVPAVITFLSFLVSTRYLYRARLSHSRNHQASLTMAIFTGAFLLCNLPFFLNTLIFALTVSLFSPYPGPLYSSNFMFFYSWVLSDLFATVLNAALNPVLYYYRMAGFRGWLVGSTPQRGPNARTVSTISMR